MTEEKCCEGLNSWKQEGKTKGYWFHYKNEVIEEYLKEQKTYGEKEKG